MPLFLSPPGLSLMATAMLLACTSPGRSDSAGAEARSGTPPAPIASAGVAADTGDEPRASRTLGSANAPITIYEMSDFQCPFCRRHALETHPQLVREYVETGKVRVVFINFPITEIHPNAVPAAQFGLCAARAGRFWDAHRLLFRHQPSWKALPDPAPFLITLADSLGISREETVSCLEDPAVTAAIRHEAEGSIRAGANSTPTFYIEGGLLVGAQPISVFRPILDSIYELRIGGSRQDR
ncbi:MAG TPA: thioredoxin domain-containing protein [Gemmatimonadales bacterium]|nr:thioredoxin domain-containing protein [Gemmatimonadales bacterium]